MIVYADDLGFADLGAVGDSGHHSASPTIDALAASGVILNSSYVYVWCAPSIAVMPMSVESEIWEFLSTRIKFESDYSILFLKFIMSEKIAVSVSHQ
eukprot:COSAG02_NODE_237_length_27732_cov_9.584374_1_plen_97_part_00